MSHLLLQFDKLTGDMQPLAGGKGGTLGRLFRAGYPVPDGFVVLPAAFVGDELSTAAWEEINNELARLRAGAEGTAFAVRSSALSEDSAVASFAGEFETVLDVHTDEMVREAIHTVRRSRHSERVLAYSRAKGMETAHELAVVVQRLVPADVSGILFTADPVTGSHTSMSGNYIQGLGDALVSGEAEPHAFTLGRPKGAYDGPAELKPFARRLFKLAMRLEKELAAPQDIEWCVAGSRLHLLQSRPITTLREFDPVTQDWNSTHIGDYLWSEPGGVYPSVMTPATWSVHQIIFGHKVGSLSFMGNIGGRLYLNFSHMYTMLRTIGRNHQQALDTFLLSTGVLPQGVEVPRTVLTLLDILRSASPRFLLQQRRMMKDMDAFLAALPERCRDLRMQIAVADASGLLKLWDDELVPLNWHAYYIQDGYNEQYTYPYAKIHKELSRLLGRDGAAAFISAIRVGKGDLTSIGITRGLAKVASGETSRKAYLEEYGHRHSDENELSAPYPYEDPDWLDRQLADLAEHPVDLDALQARRDVGFAAAWAEFEGDHPKEARKIRRLVDRVNTATHKREAIRSGLTRTFSLYRHWYLRAAELTGLGDDIFMLTYPEVHDLLAGDRSCIALIPGRREVYEKYCALPTYPAWIRGRFDPVAWADDPQRRQDVYDPHAPPAPRAEADTVRGHPGSAGRVEGLVRRIDSPDEGHHLQTGEVLVAVTTNIGWTPLFPRAAAVVTDIGAPLAHAAIVARELGIPAVVGCGTATARLRTGDRVRVDGGRGTVEILAMDGSTGA
ncbi:MAG TPA: PEP/pyruvate-binding domain-containing protein [Anaerolineae bacterium]|nr:PEP/pyruvate-binding domain-containing protein [Anaerolineae bacterium]